MLKEQEGHRRSGETHTQDRPAEEPLRVTDTANHTARDSEIRGSGGGIQGSSAGRGGRSPLLRGTGGKQVWFRPKKHNTYTMLSDG